MKKVLKIVGLLFLLLLGVLIAIPFFLESKIDKIVQNYADENLNAKLSFTDINLSLIRSFPDAEIYIEDIKIINNAPFDGDVLVDGKRIAFELPMLDLLKGTNAPIQITEIIADDLLLTIKTNAEGINNYDIFKPSTTVDDATSEGESNDASGFTFDIKHFEINNSALTYIDDTSKLKAHLTQLNHNSSGQFSSNTADLDTKTKLMLNLSMDSINYVSNTAIKLDAIIGMDLSSNTYTFKNNTGFINNLPIAFNGFVQLLDNGQNLNLSFKNADASFKDFLGVIPETYAKNVSGITTTGTFTLKGDIKGLFSDTSIPMLDINLRSENASFKYPDLPKSVKNIRLNASVKNTTGNTKDTYVDINTLDFQIDEDIFTSEVHLKHLTGNTQVDAKINGTLNLANITKAYPLELDNTLQGIVKGQLDTHFDLNAIETNAYQRIKNNGNISLTDFVFSSEELKHPVQITNAGVTFKPGKVTLNNFDAQTGQTDFKATGTLNNLLGFVLSDKKLQGNFNVNSKTFAVNDFMVENTTNTSDNSTNETPETTPTESIKIPEFLDCTINANANTVLYDNLTLKNVKGQLKINNQDAKLNNMTTDIFGGKLGLNGMVSTKTKTPKFDMNLGMQQFDISESFKNLELLKALAPIAKIIQGKLNSTINLSGDLNTDFTPNLNTVSGKAIAEVLTKKINAEQSPLLSALGSNLNFIDLKKLNLKDLKTKLKFNDGKVTIDPFTMTYDDIKIEVGGEHGFANNLNYNAVFNVPTKYLGGEVNQLIEKLNDPEAGNITIPVTANINGTFTQPKVTTDLKNSVSSLTTQLITLQKQKLIGKGKDELGKVLGGFLGKTTKSTDSTKTSTTKNSIEKGVNSVLGGLFGKKKKKN